MSPYVTTPLYTVHHVARVYTQMVQGIKVYGTVRCMEALCLYVRSCESSSSWRAAASSDAIEDLPTPDGPQRRISWPAAPPLCFDTPAGMFGQDSALRKTADNEEEHLLRYFGISLKRPAKLAANKRT